MASEYTRGEMDITDQKSTWDGFMKASVWGSAITGLILAYITMTLAIGMNWMVSLAICAVLGILGGLFMGMGGAWIGAVIGMVVLAVIVQIVITIFTALV